jgi:predicted O-methyltransferase YrrM
MAFWTIENLAANATNPQLLPQMLRKLTKRVTSPNIDSSAECARHAVNADQWARATNSDLWDEALAFGDDQKAYAKDVLKNLPHLGGGGFYPLLYFITRLVKPQVIVETGVAAGFSSRAFLTALNRNGSGTLASSDFPYFRLENPAQYIGVLVEPELKQNWSLHIDGDRENIPKIAAEVGEIDLLHYDSDKTESGRKFALNALKNNITDRTVIIFDDIQDNYHFRDFVSDTKLPHIIFKFLRKYVGMTIPSQRSELGSDPN